MPMYARFPHLLAPGGSSQSFGRLCLLVPSRHRHAWIKRRKNTTNPFTFHSLISSKLNFFHRLIFSMKDQKKHHQSLYFS